MCAGTLCKLCDIIQTCFVKKKKKHNSLFISIFKNIFLMWTIFKVLINLVTILLQFYVLIFWLQGMWDLIFLTKD